MANFTSNAFSRDQLGAGLELSVRKMFALRVGYKHELDANDIEATLDNGLSGGFSLTLPFKKDSDSRLALDYAYRQTRIFNGIHTLGIRIDL